MKIAKEFKWEMGHRLPFHKGKCKNLHGHTYKLLVEFSGDLDVNGMVMDYYDVKKVVGPIVEELDHSFIIKNDDTEVIEFLQKINSKHVVVNFETTAENICYYFLDKISDADLPSNISKIMVKVYETESTYAESERTLI
ncbi:MAG: 6-carboxytetrahydropterin synthase QueD [Melioribacteraceae bacterium]|nr:6-carboxytetrahydropterin synthase QueD [Melioribacteraceae bacterium]MCF8393333.1 6-carboxytetrahydropterin synthase QueD [Melioribacteraceae bacterium]MCF8418898.1 6-carboxytetrahydropterin synthase QueD [Melioribacteraceae bacterium]